MVKGRKVGQEAITMERKIEATKKGPDCTRSRHPGRKLADRSHWTGLNTNLLDTTGLLSTSLEAGFWILDSLSLKANFIHRYY